MCAFHDRAFTSRTASCSPECFRSLQMSLRLKLLLLCLAYVSCISSPCPAPPVRPRQAASIPRRGTRRTPPRMRRATRTGPFNHSPQGQCRRPCMCFTCACVYACGCGITLFMVVIFEVPASVKWKKALDARGARHVEGGMCVGRQLSIAVLGLGSESVQILFEDPSRSSVPNMLQ